MNIPKILITVTMVCSLFAARANQGQPNVLFIAIDDLRPELGCYGDTQVKSPNLDKFASQGLQFERAYCQVPVCGGSRASLMTGILPTPQRFKNAKARADEDVPNAATMVEVLKSAGYITISNGKIFHTPADTEERSWSEPTWHPEMNNQSSLLPETTAVLSKKKKRGSMYEMPDVPDNAYPDGQVAERTIQDLKRLKESGRPFFLGCGFLRPHMPFYAPKKYWDLYDRNSIHIAANPARPENAPVGLKGSQEFTFYYPGKDADYDSAEWHRLMRHGYYASVSYSDKLVGDVLAELDRLGLSDNTIVVIWGDHGWNLGEHNFWGKHNTLNTSVRVPLMMRVPGGVSGAATESLVECVDIYPTICAMAGAPVPDSVQGRSFAGLFKNPKQSFKDVVYSRYGGGDAVLTERYAYTSYSKNQGEMLFDLQKDPGENHNVAGNPEYAKALLKMRRLLEDRKKVAQSYP